MRLQVKLVSSLTEGTTRTEESLWSTPVEASSPKDILLEPQVQKEVEIRINNFLVYFNVYLCYFCFSVSLFSMNHEVYTIITSGRRAYKPLRFKMMQENSKLSIFLVYHLLQFHVQYLQSNSSSLTFVKRGHTGKKENKWAWWKFKRLLKKHQSKEGRD